MIITTLIESVSEGFLTYSCTMSMKIQLVSVRFMPTGTMSMPFSSPYCVLIRSRPRYVFFFLNMFKIHHVRQGHKDRITSILVSTASDRFYVVKTSSSPKNFSRQRATRSKTSNTYDHLE